MWVLLAPWNRPKTVVRVSLSYAFVVFVISLQLAAVAVCTSGSIGRSTIRTCSRTSGRLCFLCWTKLLSRTWLETTRISSGKVCVKRKNTWVWATMIPPKRKFGSACGNAGRRWPPWRAEGAFFVHPRSRRSTQGNVDSLLSHGEFTGDFDFKAHDDRNRFLVSEVYSRVAACTYLDRKSKEVLPVKCNVSKVNTAEYQHRALLQSKLLERLNIVYANEELSVDMHACSTQNMEKEEKGFNSVVIIGMVTRSLFTPVGRIYIFLSFPCRLLSAFPTTPTPFSSLSFHEHELGTTSFH